MEVENFFRIEELSRSWRVSRRSIYRRIRGGKLQSIKLGGTRLVSRSQVIEFLESSSGPTTLLITLEWSETLPAIEARTS